MRFWISCFLVQILIFGAVLGRFSQCNFWLADICAQPPHHEKASYGPDYEFWVFPKPKTLGIAGVILDIILSYSTKFQFVTNFFLS